MHAALALLALLLAPSAAALQLEYVAVRDPGNAADGSGYGAVDYDFAITRHEITNAQYVEFLNAVANETDVYGLYNPSMTGIDFPPVPIGFLGFYEVIDGFANKPVDHVSVFDAFRFANWLQGGQLSGAAGIASLEDGAYTMVFSRTAITRALTAQIFVPTPDEWYKAAYYDASTGGYFDYPAGSDAPIACAAPGASPNTANCESAAGGLTDVGAYAASPSPYGTLDQGGNVWEWTEEPVTARLREVRGGNWFATASSAGAATSIEVEDSEESIGYGFRLARLVPEPSGPLLVLAGAAALASVRATRRSARAQGARS